MILTKLEYHFGEVEMFVTYPYEDILIQISDKFKSIECVWLVGLTKIYESFLGLNYYVLY